MNGRLLLLRRPPVDIFQYRAHRRHWTDLDGQTERQAGTALRNRRGFVQIGDREEEIASHHFLGFSIGSITYPLSLRPRNHSPPKTQRLAMQHFAVGGQAVVPIVPLLRESITLRGRKVGMDIGSGVAKQQKKMSPGGA